MTAILGISAFYHDAAAALIMDGEVVAAAQEERFSRVKHDASFPRQAIDGCLRQAGIEIEQLDHVVFYEKPYLKFERLLETYVATVPSGLRSFATSMPIWLRTKLHLSRVISKGLDDRYRKRILFPQHHESHAASAFFPSPYEQAAILTVDGVGEWATSTLGIGNNNQIQLLKELRFPDSLGLLYSAFTYFCGFQVNGGEGKLMGLAPYGQPAYLEIILNELIDLKEDGSFRMNQTYFDYRGGDTMTSAAFEHRFGGPRRIPGSPVTKREQDLAASIQAAAETILLKMASHLHHITGLNHLCIAGGVGLNCVANGRLLLESPFEHVWVQPAPGDAGGAIGAALFAWHQLLDQSRGPSTMSTTYLGPAESLTSAQSSLDQQGAIYQAFADAEEVDDCVCEHLESKQTVGWFQGRMEFGPRALGNRSILADARFPDMKDVLNQQVKFREPFRPFGPVVLADRSDEFFDLDRPSPFMLFATQCRGDAPQSLPAITHVDHSARIQTVSQADNSRLHRLLSRFNQRTGCPVLINTSFNIRGEPIVCTAADAYRCFMKSGLDVLVIENFVLKKSEQPPYHPPAKPVESAVSWWRRSIEIWLFITYPLRWIVSRATLSLVFWLCLTPIGWIARRREWNSIDRDSADVSSYWKTRPPKFSKSDYFKQY